MYIGFIINDWADIEPVAAKVVEELDEVRDAMAANDEVAKADEIGDLLFAVVNLARHAGVDPELALRATNAKFRRRFAAVERGVAADGVSLANATLERMEAHWVAAKGAEREKDGSASVGRNSVRPRTDTR